MKTYPINLLLNQKKCLIVGGGKIASRKLNRLLEVDANVTLVAPKINKSILALAEAGRVEVIMRKFDVETDFHDIYLAYFATDDRSLNSELLSLAQARGIISCSVDKNWENADFITPATVQSSDLTIAISSEGVACRKTKLIKENISRHIKSLDETELVVIGTDHNFMNINERELIHLNGDIINDIGEKLLTIWGIHGFALLNTCNRVDFFGAAQCSKSVISMVKMIMKFDQFNSDKYYVKTGYEAFKHLALTASGIYSQTPGENHIMAQFKEACNISLAQHWSGSLIQSLAEDITHVSRQIRSSVSPILKSYEIEDLALKYIKKHAGITSFSDKKIMIAGSGIIGEELRKRFEQENGCQLIVVYYSNIPKSSDNVAVIQLDDIDNYLDKCDFVITAMSCNEPIINCKNYSKLSKNSIVVDLGLPRNVNLENCDISTNNLNYIDIEDLKHWHRKYNCNMDEVILIANNVVEEHKDFYEKFRKSFIDGCQR